MLDWLKTILGETYSEEIDKRISEEIGKNFVARADFNSLNAEKKTLTDTVKERDKQLETLKTATGETFDVPANMTYAQWKKKQDALHGQGTVDKMRKISYNESADRKLWEKYREELGKNAPKSFAAFRKIRYGDNWDAFKAYARAIKSGELTALADFNLYRKKSAEIDRILVGTVTKNGLNVTGKSKHYIARTISSVVQRQNGVDVPEALDALTNPVQTDPVRVDANGKSQRFKGKTCYVTINPDTGVLIQTNPHKGGK